MQPVVASVDSSCSSPRFGAESSQSFSVGQHEACKQGEVSIHGSPFLMTPHGGDLDACRLDSVLSLATCHRDARSKYIAKDQTGLV